MDKHTEELIDAYVDELITPDELRELDALLVAEPEVARAFCRRLRMDHHLYTHFNAVNAEAVVREQIQQNVNRANIYSYKRASAPPLWHVIREHLWGPVGSLLFHTALITMLFSFAAMDLYTGLAPDVQVMLIQPEVPTVEAPVQETFDDSGGAATEAREPPAIEVAIDVEPDAEPVELPALHHVVWDVAELLESPVSMRGAFRGRREQERKAMLAQYAGAWGETTEKSVVKALKWLKKRQRDNGSWWAGPAEQAGDSSAIVAVTSLALLSFLAHDETSASEEFGPTVTQAIRFLYEQQRTNGAYCAINKHGVYAHAIATYAMSEAFGITRIPVLKQSMERGVSVILDGQQRDGGWNYGYDKGPRHDVSVAGWQIQALKASVLAGSTNARTAGALSLAARNLMDAQQPDGSFLYASDGETNYPGSAACTATAVLCLQLTGHAREPVTRRGISTLTREKCDWKKAEEDPWSLYKHYYLTQTLFHFGGHAWQQWNDQLAKAYTTHQQENGSWLAPRARQPGAEGHTYCEAYYGPSFTTALATLTMEVYYRFLPTFKAQAAAPLGEDAPPPDDIRIEIQNSLPR